MMNVITYKRYKARLKFDPRDNIFIGHVLNVSDDISFHGETVAELIQAPHEAIDHYVEDCAKGKRDLPRSMCINL